MTVNIAISGFGRIGRLCLRAALEYQRNDINFVAINARGSIDELAHLFRYDSAHGTYPHEITTGDDWIDFGNNNKVKIFLERDPAKTDWQALGCDIVMDCTGAFNKGNKIFSYIDGGAKKVLVSAPCKDADIMAVYGVNHDKITADHKIISNASCTTNCLAPVVYALDKAVGVKRGYMTTIHSYTGDQNTVDTMHKDMRRARASAVSIIPTTTGAARAIGEVIPHLKGKLDGAAMRVPTHNVSLIDLTFTAHRNTSIDEINNIMRDAAENELKGIVAINDQPLVSVDFNHHPASAIFDTTQTQILGDDLVRVVAWYDNEWGFSVRMFDMAKRITSL